MSSIKTVSAERLVDIFRNREGLLFCGAGISIEPPAGLPDWHGLRDHTLAAIAARDEIPQRYLANLTSVDMMASPGKKGMTPELVASVVLAHSPNYFDSFRCLEKGEPNTNHKYISRLAKLGVLRCVLTTNWDLFIERALEQEQVPYTPYRSEDDFESFTPDPDRVHLLKLHGCISIPATTTVTVEQEGQGLSPAKRHVLDILLQQYYFVFWGYSGADLKIDLDYLRMQTMRKAAKGFLWNLHVGPQGKELPNPNVLKLQELYGRKGCIIYGQLPHVFEMALPAGQSVEHISYSNEEVQAWTESKNAALVDSLRIWAGRCVQPLTACSIFGVLLSHNGERDEELACYGRMIDLARESNDKRALGRALLNIGVVYKEIGKLADALLYLNESKVILRESVDQDSMPIVLYQIANVESRLGRYQHALAHYVEAAQLAQRFGDQHKVIMIHESLAYLYRDQGQFERAREFSQEAEQFFRSNGDKLALVKVLCSLGDTSEDFTQSYNYYIEAKNIAESLNYKELLDSCCSRLGGLYLFYGRYEEALLELKRAEILAEETQDRESLSSILHQISDAYAGKAAYEEALSYLERAGQLARDIGLQRKALEPLFSAAQINVKQAQYKRALTIFQEVQQQADVMGDELMVIKCSEHLGNLYQQHLTRPREAKRCYEKALGYGAGLEFSARMLHEIAICNERISGKPAPSLFDILSAAVREEPQIHSALSRISRDLEFRGEPFDLESFSDWLLHENCNHSESRELAAGRLFFTLLSLCNSHREAGRFQEAGSLYRGPEEIARQLDYKFGISIVLNEKGLNYCKQGTYQEAITYYLESLELARDLNSKQEISTRYYNLGSVCMDFGVTGAADYLQRAAGIAREIAKPEHLLSTLYHIGRLYRKHENFEEVVRYYGEAEPLAREAGDLEKLLDIFMGLGKSYRELGSPGRSLSYRKEALRVAEAIEEDGVVAIALCKLIANLYDLELLRPAEAIKYYERAFSYLEEQGDRAQAAEVRHLIEACQAKITGAPDTLPACSFYLLVRNIAGSNERAQEMLWVVAQAAHYPLEEFEPRSFAAVLEQRLGQGMGLVRLCYDVGKSYKKRGQNISLRGSRDAAAMDYEIGLMFYRIAEIIARRIGEQDWLASVLMEIGDMYLAKQQYENALQTYDECRNIFRQQDNNAYVHSAICKIAGVYHKQGQYDHALQYALQAVEIGRNLPKGQPFGFDLYLVGTIHVARKEYAEALTAYEEAEQKFRAAGEQGWLENVLHDMGATYFYMREYDYALQSYRAAEQLVRASGNSKMLERVLNRMADTHTMLGDSREASRVRDQALDVKKVLQFGK